MERRHFLAVGCLAIPLSLAFAQQAVAAPPAPAAAAAKPTGPVPAEAMDGITTNTHKAEIDRQAQEAMTIGASGTPVSFVNGRFLSGSQR